MDNFDLLSKHRKKNISKHKSGGIALAYRKSLKQYITLIDTESRLVLWFATSKRLTKTEDILRAVIYIPPESSDYAINNPYQEIENELYTLQTNSHIFLLLGDFNSRTNNLIDYIEIDEYICTHFNSDELFFEYEKEISIFFNDQQNCVSIHRRNSDTGINNYGYRLLDLCKCTNLYILNERTARDNGIGAPTCRNASTVDYSVCSPNLISVIKDFFVEEFCEILSDVHCPVYLLFYMHVSILIEGFNATKMYKISV